MRIIARGFLLACLTALLLVCLVLFCPSFSQSAFIYVDF
jgi:hypothetical protein